jgi:site-specific DNA-cytosine methylase
MEVNPIAYCFEPGAAKRLGGYVWEELAPTLRTEVGDNRPSVAYTLQDREGKAGGGKGALIATELSATLRAGFAQTLFQPVECIDQGGGKSACNVQEGQAPTLTCTHGGEPVVCYSKSKRAQSDTDYETWKESDVANTINAFDVGDKRTTECVVALDRASFNQGKNALYDFEVSDKGVKSPLVAKGPSAVCYSTNHGTFHTNAEEGICATLQATDYKDPPIAYYPSDAVAVDARNGLENDVNGSLQSNMAHSLNGNNVIRTKYIVRRLTPLECERLQGYPDGWTDTGEWIDSKGKVHKTSDAARYKALGNSIALPPWKWVLKRLCACYERDATLASLFDGIGGFPLIWEQINGKGTCLWASEIEEFPIAVTKVRIGE